MVRTSWVKTLYDGDVFFPGYSTHKADMELTIIARAQNMHVYNANCTLLEYDPDKTFGRPNPGDDILFKNRFMLGFGGLVPGSSLDELAKDYSVAGMSIIILHAGDRQQLDNLITGFLRVNTFQPLELIVLQQGQDAETVELLTRFCTRLVIRPVVQPREADAPASTEDLILTGFRKACYRNILIVRSSMFFSRDSLGEMETVLKDPNTGLIAIYHEQSEVRTSLKQDKTKSKTMAGATFRKKDIKENGNDIARAFHNDSGELLDVISSKMNKTIQKMHL